MFTTEWHWWVSCRFKWTTKRSHGKKEGKKTKQGKVWVKTNTWTKLWNHSEKHSEKRGGVNQPPMRESFVLLCKLLAKFSTSVMWVGVKDSLLLCHHTSAPEEMGPWSGGELSSSLSLYGWNLQSTVRRGATRKRKILHPETIFMFAIYQADCSPKFGVMSQCWCRRVVLCVELGVLVAVLAAGSTAQLFERRQAGSSCYGGFDLYFVLDKWVLLFLLDHRRDLCDSAVPFEGTGARIIQAVIQRQWWAASCLTKICECDVTSMF